MPRKRLDQDVVRELRLYITGMPESDDRLPPLRELAERFDVSVPTVRIAQAILLEEGLLAARQGSRVVVTARGRLKLLGIISELDLLQPRTSRYYPDLISQLRALMAERGYRSEIYLGETHHGDMRPTPTNRRFLADLRSGRLHGGVLVTAPKTAAWEELVATTPVPLVGIMTRDTQGLDLAGRVRAAFGRLHAAGVRRVAYMGWLSGHSADVVLPIARECGLDCRPEWVADGLSPSLPGSGWEGFREIWRASREKPQGVVIMDDILAADAALAILELGIRVPDELIVVAEAHAGNPEFTPFDHIQLQIDVAASAHALMDALDARLAGRDPGALPLLQYTLADVAQTGRSPRPITLETP